MPATHARVDIGMVAPDFALTEANGRTVTLRELRGQAVILAFYPPEWDPARADQLAHFNWLVRQVPGVHAELLGISTDGMWCELAFRGDPLRVPLLADLDPQGAVAAQYGVTGEHAIFVIDAEGRVAWRHAGTNGTTPRVDDVLRALSALASPRSAAQQLPDRSGITRNRDARDRPLLSVHASVLSPTRRDFMATALAAAFALAARPLAAAAEPLVGHLVPPIDPAVAPSTVTLRINGRAVSVTVEPRVTLLDALREYAGLTGTKKGCDHGQCGACTVHVNGRRQLSCLTFAVMHQDAEITTVEGLASGSVLHPLQAAFIAHDGFQCGYCTPGQLMSAAALLTEPCGPTDVDVKECMSGNICRCGAYPGIVAAIQDVRTATRG
jgi:xanthine dehydrogenase YagT iron-sulfur-binding subunit